MQMGIFKKSVKIIQSCRNDMSKLKYILAGIIPSILTLASKDINKGKVSPIGDAVAIFPEIVPTLRIWVEPYLFKIL